MSAPATASPSPEASDAAPVRTGHPPALYLLFTTEMWERMSYYGMRALLTLYMVAATNRGGFGWSRGWALQVYGLYTALVYLTPLGGGYLADRYLGQRNAVMLGGALMMLGHFLMAVPGVTAFYAALSFLIIGNGFFKPNISTMVGGLYAQGDPRRDGAFTIFYMGINLGAFLSPLVCGTLGEKLGWHWGFGSAGVGMALGLAAFALGHKRLLGDVGLSPREKAVIAAKNAPAPPSSKEHSAGYREGAEGDREVETPKPAPLTTVEKQRLGVIFTLSFFNIFFWAAFEQAGGLMSLYTDEKVDRHLGSFLVPTTWFQAINPLFIVLLGPVFSALWIRLGKVKRDPPTATKMALGLFLLSLGFVFMLFASKQTAGGGKASLVWVVLAYLLHTLGELCLSPVGLSMVTKLAPAKLASLMMGVWLLSSFFANYIAGWVGGYSEKLGEFQLFASIVAATALAGGVLFALSKKLTALTHGAEGTPAPASH